MGKYDHIDFKPPKSVADSAKRGLELRKKNKGRGGLNTQQAKQEGVGSGVQRAVNLKNRDSLSPSTVRRMKSFFDRHEKNKKTDPGKQKSEDKGYISWLIWGGDPGRSWANKIVNQMNAADKKQAFSLTSKLTALANKFDTMGLYGEADKIDEILKRAVNYDIVPENQRNTDNMMGYIGGDAVGGGYSAFSVSEGQPAEDQSQEFNVYKNLYEVASQRSDHLVQVVNYLQQRVQDLEGVLYSIGEMYKIPVEKYFETSKAREKEPTQEQNNADMIAAVNGLRGTSTDEQNFSGMSDAYFYSNYGNLEAPYGGR